MNFQMFKLDLEKAKEPESKWGLIHCIIKKAREFQKNIYFCFIDYTQPLAVRITTNWNHLTCLLRNLYAGQEATGRIGYATTDWFHGA